MMKGVQPNVYFTNTKKLLFTKSPLRKAYPPDGLTVEKLLIENRTKSQQLLCIYRNLLRSVKYLQIHTFLKKSLIEVFKIKIRQDYRYRKAIFLDELEPGSSSHEKNCFILKKLVNTVNFVHNAALDTPENRTKRPVSAEFKILYAIIEYEQSKAIPNALQHSIKSKFITLDMHKQLRQSERAWNMQESFNFNPQEKLGSSSYIWWLDTNSGIFKNDIAFGYLEEFQSMKKDNLLEKTVLSILDFERSLVLLNEECDLLL